MFSCTVEGDPDHPVAKLSGNLSLENCRRIHAELLALLSRADAITVDLGESEKSDLSFIQILHALIKKTDKKIVFANLPDHLLENAARLGAHSFLIELSNRLENNA
jgi:hypothetical protein